MLNGPEIISKFLGESEKNLRLVCCDSTYNWILVIIVSSNFDLKINVWFCGFKIGGYRNGSLT